MAAFRRPERGFPATNTPEPYFQPIADRVFEKQLRELIKTQGSNSEEMALRHRCY
jgi:hypothetical protein